MTDSRQHVLVVGAKKAGLERVAPMLRRADFSVHSVEPSPFLLDLVLSTQRSLLCECCGHPNADKMRQYDDQNSNSQVFRDDGQGRLILRARQQVAQHSDNQHTPRN